MSNIKFISLDFSGTIVTGRYVDYFWREAIPRVFAEERGINIDEAKERVFKEYEKVKEDDINWYLPEYWIKRLNIRKKLKDIVEDSLKAIEIYSDAEEFIEKMSKKCKILIASSVTSSLILPAVQFLKLKIYKVYSSSDLFIVGKTPDFYKFILEDLGISAKDIVHIGDNEKYDFYNPRTVGIKSYLVNREKGIDLSYLTKYIEV